MTGGTKGPIGMIERRSLERLLKPMSVAVVGGGAWCRDAVEGLRRLGYAWEVWPVHPEREAIAGVKCLRRLSDLPYAPDAVFVGVNRTTTIDVVRELSEMGAGGVVCFASGFAETKGGAEFQKALLDAAGDMPLIGPNSYGFVNAMDRASLWPDVHSLKPVSRGVAILTQSSNIALSLTMQQRGLPIAFIASAGNQAQIGLAELGEAVLADPRVSALALHVEGVGDLRAFESMALTAQRLGKPVVVLKTGRSAQAREAAMSHTASLAGTDAGADALLERSGIARVYTLEAMLEALKILHFAGPLPSKEIAALSCAGGEASLMADAADLRDIPFARLSDDQVERLSDTLGPMVHVSNPLDFQTFIWGDAEKMTEVFSAMMQGQAVLTVVIVDFPKSDRAQGDVWEAVIEAAIAARARVGMPLALLATLPENMPEEISLRLMEGGVIPLHGLGPSLSGISAAAVTGQLRRFATPVVLPVPQTDVRVLDEAEGKALLSDFGVAVPKGESFETAEEAAHYAEGLGPVALKSLGLTHKSDFDGVVLGLSGKAAVLDAVQKMPGQGFLVEAMVPDGLVELLVGVVADPAHGYVMTLAAGGVLTEILQDSAHLLIPASREDIRSSLMSLRLAPMLSGYRGRPACDLEAVLDVVMALQECVAAQGGRVDEVEINPLVVTSDSAVAVDVLFRMGEDS